MQTPIPYINHSIFTKWSKNWLFDDMMMFFTKSD